MAGGSRQGGGQARHGKEGGWERGSKGGWGKVGNYRMDGERDVGGREGGSKGMVGEETRGGREQGEGGREGGRAGQRKR